MDAFWKIIEDNGLVRTAECRGCKREIVISFESELYCRVCNMTDYCWDDEVPLRVR